MTSNTTNHYQGPLFVYLYTALQEASFFVPDMPFGLRVGRSGYKAFLPRAYNRQLKGVKRTGGARLTTLERSILMPIIQLLQVIPPTFKDVTIFTKNYYFIAELLSIGWPDDTGWRQRAQTNWVAVPDDDLTEQLRKLGEHFNVVFEMIQGDYSTYQGFGDRAARKTAADRQRPVDRWFEARTPWVPAYLAERASTERPYEGPSVAELMESEDWHW